MTLDAQAPTDDEIAELRRRRFDAMHSQAIEDNPLNADDVAIFEMFEREGWSHERRRAYLDAQAREMRRPAAE